MKRYLSLHIALLAGAFLSPLAAQVPDQLAHTILAPETGAESGMRQGAAVAASTDYLVVGAAYDDIAGRDAGAVRVYDATTGALLHTIPNPAPSEASNFGAIVALSGDRLAVRASETFIFTTAVVYLYDLGASEPTEPQYTYEGGDGSFGESLAIDGDRLIIGAPDELRYYFSAYSYVDLGRIYVYDLAGPTPETPELEIDGPVDGENLGTCLAIDGNLLVAGSDTAFAQVYDLDGASPETPIAELEHPDGLDLDQSADIKDPYVVITNDTENSGAGAAYVFDLSLPDPSVPIHELQAAVPEINGHFGRDVAIAMTKIVVTAEDTLASTSAEVGGFFVFDLLAADPTNPILTIANPGSESDDWFGESIALTGAQLLVGAPFESSTGFRDGRSYVFELDGATPAIPTLELSDIGPEKEKEFGQAVSLSGDYLAVGAPLDDATAFNGGSATLFDLGSGSPTVPLFTAQHPDPQEYSNFGHAVALNGRYLAVGAPEQDVPGENDAGTVYIFDTQGATPATPIHTLEPETPDSDFPFGSSVVLNDDWIVVAAPDPGGGLFSSEDGRVTVYEFSNPGSPLATLTESPDQNNAFGVSIALDGDRLAIGATDGDLANGDWVYLYDLGSANPTTPILSLPNPNPPIDPFSPINEGLFGQSVALSGDWLAVGAENTAHLYDLGAANPEASMVKIVFVAGTFDGIDIPYFGSYRVAVNGNTLVVAVEGYESFIRAFDLGLAQPLNTPTDIVPGLVDLSEYDRLPLSVDGRRLAVGVPEDDQAGTDNGAVYVFDRSPTPEIAVDAKGESLVTGISTVRIGLGTLGTPTAPVEVTINNLGGAPLTGLAISKAGPHAGDFLLNTSGLATSIDAGAETAITVTFNASGTSLRQAQLQITSNDADENPFVFGLEAWSLSASDDTDGDGLNDLAEWNLAPLGFNWRDPQPALVETLLDNANFADLFTSDQIGALSVNGVIGQNPASGTFLLTLGVRKSTDHETYDPFPMSDAATQINPEGKLEFQFTVPEDTAFFELEAE